MKVCSRSKTSLLHLLSMAALVLFWSLVSVTHTDAQQTSKVRKVVLDPGHGGKDPGCHGHHSREKEIALNIALELGRMIEAKFPDVEVIYTRKTDVFVALNERAAIANRNKADLFISIHCNYIGARNRATGSETFVLGLHRAEDNLDVAKRENASILLEDDFEKTYDGFDPYSAEGHIILSMFQNAHLEQSIILATNIEEAFKKLAHLPSRGVKQAGFLVLRETTMPSVLIETGFLSTDRDEAFLMMPENQAKVAGAILKAFGQYKKDIEGPQQVIADAEEEIKDIKPSPPTSKPNTPVTGAKTTEKSGPNPDEAIPPAFKTGNQLPASSNVIYRIQVAASSKSSIDARYHNLEDLEVIKEDSLYKFVVGKFSTRDEALERLKSLRASGFEGAFIITYRDGVRVKA